jgi:Zn-dependent protease with chaperone function
MAKQSYSGCAFYPALGEEVVTGTISFNSASLFFFAQNGKIEIPLHRLQIRLDDTSQRIYFNDPQQPAGNIFTDDLDIFQHRAFVHVAALRDQVARLSGSKNALLKLAVVAACFFAVFLLIAIIIFSAGGVTLRYLVNKVPTTYESDIGEKLVAKLKARSLLTDDPKVIAYLHAVSKELLPKKDRSKFKFEFHVVPISEPNAFAVPGGKIFVTEGALTLLTREELTGVLAHELTHVTRRHALRQVISTLGTYAAFKLLVQGDSAFQGAVGDASEKLFTSGFSQTLENEADDGGWDYLVAANIDPRCLPNSLRKLEAEQSRREKDPNAPSKLFSTHPLTAERLKRFEKKWNALPKKTGFIDFSKTYSEKMPQ